MKQLRGNKTGGQPTRKVSPSGKESTTSAVQMSDDAGQAGILNPKLLAQKRTLQGLSAMGGGSAGSTEDAKRPRLLPEVNRTAEESEEEESDDSDYERAESDNEASDDTYSEDDDEDDESGSDASENSREDPEGTTREPSSKPDLAKELSSMSFEELLQLRKQVGTKAYERMTSGKSTATATRTERRPCPSKHKPLEMSAKKPVPFLRHVVPVKKKLPRDPRFDDLSGEYKPEIFEKTYGFLNDLRKKEKEVVQKQLKKSRNTEQRSRLQRLLRQMAQQEAAQKRLQKEREKMLVFKRQQRELAQQGKKPFYLKKSDKRKWELAEKYKELKKSGKLESFLSKKRKRNAAKDKRKLPFRKDV